MSTDLVRSGIEKRTLTYFALGGSGIRALEPLLHLCALGLGPRQLKVVFIDPDQTNDAVSRSRRVVELYRKTRAAVGEGGAPSGYFRTEVIDVLQSTLLWSPIADDEHLPDARFITAVDRSLMASGRATALGHLHDLLFPGRLRTMDLGQGFRGVPPIGTLFMNRLREEPFFRQLHTDAQADADGVYFAVGTIFGGTGAAALPVVGRALTETIAAADDATDIPGIPARRVSCAVLLPYFTLPAATSGTAPDDGPRPMDSLFAQNAAAAITAYTSGQGGYGSCYVIGDSQPRQQDVNAVGGEKQKNRSHYIELFAALSALDFAARGGEAAGERLPVFYGTAVEDNNVHWADLPLDQGSRQRLMGGFVAAHTFLSIFRPNGGSQRSLEKRLKGATWVENLGLTAKDLSDRSAAFDALGQYFKQMWDWLGELRASTPSFELVRADGRPPTNVRLDETIEGYRRTSGNGRVTTDGFEVFRHWNTASYHHARQGYGGFLEVMREGSEAFASDRFAEAIKVGEAR